MIPQSFNPKIFKYPIIPLSFIIRLIKLLSMPEAFLLALVNSLKTLDKESYTFVVFLRFNQSKTFYFFYKISSNS